MNSSTRRIPTELFHPIVENLENDKASLCAVSLSSRTLRDEGQRVLYRDATDLHDVDAHFKFLNVVASSPDRLALLVHAYAQAFSRPTRNARTSLFSPEFLESARTALEAMKNLKQLKVDWTASLEVPSMIQGCTFNLERFDCKVVKDWRAFFTDFLPRQTNLKHLGLYMNSAVREVQLLQEIPATMCPNMISLSGSWDVIERILPGRKIPGLKWTDHAFPLDDEDIQDLAPELKHVQALSYLDYERQSDREYLAIVAPHFSHIAILELDMFRIDDDEFMAIIPEFSSLHTLVFSYSYILGERTSASTRNIHEIIRCMFNDLTKKLQYIEVHNEDMQTHLRYAKSDANLVEQVSSYEVRRFWL